MKDKKVAKAEINTIATTKPSNQVNPGSTKKSAAPAPAAVRTAKTRATIQATNANQGTGNLMSDGEFKGLLQYIVDYRKDLTRNRQYIRDPWNWQNELQNNIKPLIDAIPSSLPNELRIQIVDAIIIAEAQSLQA